VFVEVKNYSTKSVNILNPLVKISSGQIHRLKRAINYYSAFELANVDLPPHFSNELRLDVVLIFSEEINHITNISGL
jgi:Holliday junction resolvase-like predicted endonuclease